MLSNQSMLIRSLLESFDGEKYTPGKNSVSYKDLNARLRAASPELIDAKKSKAGREIFNKMQAGRRLFTDETANPKLEKSGIKFARFHTKGLTLTPHKKTGRINMCPCATDDCANVCLNMSGMGPMSQESRLRRTNLLLDHPAEFLHGVDAGIENHTADTRKKGKQAVVRLNVVSDLVWEQHVPHLFEKHNSVQFYDYTKIANRMLNPDKTIKKLPDNYHLTLSSTGVVGKDENWGNMHHVLRQGGSGAMVFKTLAARGTPGELGYRKGQELPKYIRWIHEGQPHVSVVVDGDEHDLRFLDKEIANGSGAYNQAQKDHPDAIIVPGVVAGLRVKGQQKFLDRVGDFAVDIGTGHTVDVDSIRAAYKPKGSRVPLSVRGKTLKEVFQNFLRELYLRG